MNNIKLFGLLGICILFALLFAFKSCELEKVKQLAENNRVPDTIFVAKPYKVIEIKKEYIEKPVKVIVYLKDTTLRKQAEHSDIITGINFKRHNLFNKMDFITIDKINPHGIVLSHEYEVPPVREIKIDMNGNLQTKKKRYIGLKIIASALIVGTTTYFIHQEFKK
jgi:hypothetical protein